MSNTIDPGNDVTEREKQGVFARWRNALQAEWKVFAASTAGKRFQERYHRKRTAERPTWQKIVSPVLGVMIVVSGLILLPAPGPGIPIVLIGFALVAEHFLWVAKLLDQSEPPLRKLLNLCLRWWQHAPHTQRWIVAILFILLVLGLGAGLFVLLS